MKAHYCVNYARAPYSLPEKERRLQNRERHAAAKAAGLQEKYFQFTLKDELGKKKAKTDADKHANVLRSKYPGIEIEVIEGSFI